MKIAFSVFAGILFTFFLAISGCDRLPPSKPLNELTPQEAAGHQVFVARCARCHHADSLQGLHGPGLKGLFRRPYLPSGGVANDERVTAVILRGRNMMPGQGDSLNEQELMDLLAYLHTL